MAAWLPELFPTRIRATGAGFVFNAPGFVAWIGPLIAGTLIATIWSSRYGDWRDLHSRSLRWSRLSEQFLRIDKWSVCQG
jgi:MFS family permease